MAHIKQFKKPKVINDKKTKNDKKVKPAKKATKTKLGDDNTESDLDYSLF